MFNEEFSNLEERFTISRF